METKKIVRKLDLSAYEAVYAGQWVDVWVNPTKEMAKTRSELLRSYAGVMIGEKKQGERAVRRLLNKLLRVDARAMERAGKKQAELMSVMWSQGDDAGNRWSVDEVDMLRISEPTLYAWMVRESFKLVDDFLIDKKK